LGLLISLQSCLGLIFFPLVEIRSRNHFHGAGHVTVTFTTELSTDDEGLQCRNGGEPHWDLFARDGVLLDAHRDDGVVVDDVQATDIKNGRAIQRELQQRCSEIVQRIRVAIVDTELVVTADESRIDTTEFSICAWVVIGPPELPTDNANTSRVLALNMVPLVCTVCPQRERKAEQKHGLNDDHADLKVTGKVTAHTLIGCFWIPGLPEAPEAE
jgi:hypothetical protein